MCVLEEYDYRFYLAPKLSTSSLSYKDLFVDEATDKVGNDCRSVVCSGMCLHFNLKLITVMLRVASLELCYFHFLTYMGGVSAVMFSSIMF